jgi:pimeloyl-ACP methyl ester carboxylesterase
VSLAPHDSPGAAVNVRRGLFWVAGDAVDSPSGTVLRGSMYVEWEAPAGATARTPVIFVHGGGGQGTDWRSTADGRPGWLDLFVRAGHPCYVVDRPGHGRSPAHPAILGPAGPAGGIGSTLAVFASPTEGHSQWPWGRDVDSPEVVRIAASSGFLPSDLATSQGLDRDRLSGLLDMTGPAILVTHSLGAPSGWLAAAARPDAVRAIVAIEPPPPHAELPVGTLGHGLTAVELGDLRAGLPIAIVRSEVSPFRGAAEAVLAELATRGAAVELLDLASLGVTGNGHGVMLEANSDEAARPVLQWIDRTSSR